MLLSKHYPTISAIFDSFFNHTSLTFTSIYFEYWLERHLSESLIYTSLIQVQTINFKIFQLLLKLSVACSDGRTHRQATWNKFL